MIEAHVLDSWTRLDVRDTWQFGCAMMLGGFAAPLFLYCAGLSVALSSASKLRRLGERGAAARAVMTRGAWLFVLAFLFRIQAWILGWSHNPAALLKVDILNVMGPAIVAAGAVWAVFESRAARCAAFAIATAVVAFSTPAIHETAAVAFLPDPVENYLRPPPRSNWFSLFPWSGFVFAGAVPGLLLSDTPPGDEEARLNKRFALAGVAIAALAYGCSFFSSLVGRSEFWGGSPSFFFIRVGVLTAAIPFAYLWHRRMVGQSWSPVQQFGRTSLFVYWIHVEMVYGLISLRIHKSMTHPQAWAALAAFVVFMLGCSVLKDRVASAWAARGHPRLNASAGSM